MVQTGLSRQFLHPSVDCVGHIFTLCNWHISEESSRLHIILRGRGDILGPPHDKATVRRHNETVVISSSLQDDSRSINIYWKFENG